MMLELTEAALDVVGIYDDGIMRVHDAEVVYMGVESGLHTTKYAVEFCFLCAGGHHIER